MAVIVWEGIIITILVVTGLREAIMKAIPMALKRSIGVGIGLFILFIGLVDGGFVAGALRSVYGGLPPPTIVVFVIGLAVALVLMVRKVPGALLISIFAFAPSWRSSSTLLGTVDVLAYRQGRLHAGRGRMDGHAQLRRQRSRRSPALGPRARVWTRPGVPILTVVLVVFALMLSDFFDTMGTVIGVGEEAGLLDKDGDLPGIGRVLLVDSLARRRRWSRLDQLEHDLHRVRRRRLPRVAGPASRRSSSACSSWSRSCSAPIAGSFRAWLPPRPWSSSAT